MQMKVKLLIMLTGMCLFFISCSSNQKQSSEQQQQNITEQQTQNEMKEGLNNSEIEMERDTTPSKNQ